MLATYTVPTEMPIHDPATVGIAISIPLHNLFAALEFEVSIDETVVVRKCCAGSPFAVATVAMHCTLIASSDCYADSATIALGRFGDLCFAGHGEVVTMMARYCNYSDADT